MTNKKKIKLRSMSWHPNREQLALATEKQGIFFYNLNETKHNWKNKVLFHPLMQNIRKIKYNPLGTILAVINMFGIFLYRFKMLNKQRHNLDYKEKGMFLLIRLHKNCENIEFSPCGKYFISWTTVDGKLRLWNCTLKESYLILHHYINKVI